MSILSSGLPVVTCNITCPGDIVSSVTIQMTSSFMDIPVLAPYYSGLCQASVEAVDYTPDVQNLNMVTYTQCSFASLSTPAVFNQNSNATFIVNSTLSGPIGNIQIDSFIVAPNNPSLTYGSFENFSKFLSIRVL